MGCATQSGVYKITCTLNGGYYIGSTKCFTRRWAEHRRALGARRHINPKLQAAWDKYGGESFTFTVLAFCPEDVLLEREQQLLDTWCPPLNLAKTAGRPPGVVWTPEARLAKSRAMVGAGNPFYGRQHSPDMRRESAIRQRDWVQTAGHPAAGKAWGGDREAQAATMRRLHAAGVLQSWQRGRPFSDEQKAKQRATIQRNGGRAGRANGHYNPELDDLFTAAQALVAAGHTVQASCALVGLARITFYKRKKAANEPRHAPETTEVGQQVC